MSVGEGQLRGTRLITNVAQGLNCDIDLPISVAKGGIRDLLDAEITTK